MNWGDYSWLPGFVLALILGIAGFIYYWNSRKTKTLDYHIVSDQAILSTAAQSVVGIELTVGGAELSDPRLVTIQYKNTGNEPILAADFLRPITLADKVPVYSISVDETPINVRVQLGGSETSILPDVMNKGESMEVGYLVDTAMKGVKPDYRIVGATRGAKDLAAVSRKRYWVGRGAYLLTLLAVLFVLVLTNFKVVSLSTALSTIGVAFVVGAVISAATASGGWRSYFGAGGAKSRRK